MGMTTYNERKKQGVCAGCGAIDDRIKQGFSYCAKCCSYRKKVYQARKKANICVNCGKMDALTMIGKNLCYDCNEVVKKRNSESNRRKYNRLKSQGICVRCAKNKAVEGQVHCKECKAKKAKMDKAWQKRRTASKQFNISYLNVCYTCRKNPFFEDKKVCESCYNDIIKATTKANEVRVFLAEVLTPIHWKRIEFPRR